MNKIYLTSVVLITSLFLTFSSCIRNYDEVIKITNECKDTVAFGGKNFCLPEIEGLTNYYAIDSAVFKYANSLLPKENVILGYYVQTQTVEKTLDDLSTLSPLFALDSCDFLFVYSTEYDEKQNMSESEFKAFTKSYLKKQKKRKRKDVYRELEKNADSKKYNSPVMFETFTKVKDSESFVYIQKMKTVGDPKLYLFTTNFLLLKNKLLVVSYFTVFHDKKTYKELKIKNKILIKSLFENNDIQ